MTYSKDSHIILALTVTLTLKTAKQSFCMTLWHMIYIYIHHPNRFGYKSLKQE